ncbi:YIP1 family protein [Methanothermococcus sp. SCGC AD-155-N22]|nr:YIP1 family protein [Methanothermococcus sp. SCGC AD-155-N22]
MNIKDLILNPDKFFRDLSSKEPSLIIPFLIVLAVSVLDAIYMYFRTLVMINLFPPDIQSKISIILAISLLFSLLSRFVVWLLIASLMHLISAAFDGEGSFKRTLEFTGYGFLPNLIGLLIIIPISYYFLSNVQIPTLTMEQLQDPTVVKKIISSIIPKTMLYTTFLIDIAVILWNFGLWTYGIRYARNLDLNRAFIVALVPTILLFVYQLFGIIKML